MLAEGEEADKVEAAAAEEADLAEEEEVEGAEANHMAPQPLTPVILEEATHQQNGGPSLLKRWPSAEQPELDHQTPLELALQLQLP